MSTSETELAVLKCLWSDGPGTVRAIESALRAAGREWAYTTVATLLARLEKKGLVASERAGVKKVFRPIVSRDALLGKRLRALSEELGDGRPVALVNALIRGNDLTDREVSDLRRLLDEAEGRSSGSSATSPADGEEGSP